MNKKLLFIVIVGIVLALPRVSAKSRGGMHPSPKPSADPAMTIKIYN